MIRDFVHLSPLSSGQRAQSAPPPAPEPEAGEPRDEAHLGGGRLMAGLGLALMAGGLLTGCVPQPEQVQLCTSTELPAGSVSSMKGTHNGHYEDVQVTMCDGTMRLKGTHNGHYEDLKLDLGGHLKGTHNGHYEDLQVTRNGNVTRLKGTHNGHYEDLTMTVDGDQTVVKGTHNGHYESLTVQRTGDTTTVKGTHNGHYENLTVTTRDGVTTLKGTHNGHYESTTLTTANGQTRVKGTHNGHYQDLTVQGEVDPLQFSLELPGQGNSSAVQWLLFDTPEDDDED